MTNEDLGRKGKCIQCGHAFVFSSTIATEAPTLPKKPVKVPAPPRKARPKWQWGALAAAVCGLPAIILIVLGLDLGGARPPSIFGKVTYKHQPLTSGAISFIGENGIYRSSIENSGSYHVADCPPGPVIVTVRSVNTSLQKQKGDKIELVAKSLIPTRYNDAKTSGLKYSISSDRQEINIDLED